MDVQAHRLTLKGEPIRVERRPFDLLVLLISRRGQLVPRDEIVRRLWPSSVVIDFEAGLNTLVRKARLALGDSSDAPVFIETIAGRGYRFVAPVVAIHGRESLLAPSAPETKQPARAIAIAATLIAIAVLLLGIWQLTVRHPPTTSIAVLPFENLSGNPQLGYLATGLAQETSASLTRIDPRNLRVIGDVSTQALVGSSLSSAEIGHELGADYVVRSSLQVDQSHVRVNSRLIRVADNEQVWSAAFDRELLSLLGLQRELSIAIAEQIRLRLSPDVAAQIDHRQTQNPEAYQLYLQGRHAWGQFTPASNRDALQYYRRATVVDPDYALAWAGIAQALALAPMTTDADPRSVAGAARDALQKAVLAGPDLAEVMYAKGYVNFFLDWNMAEAEAAARQAVLLDPNNALAHMFLGVVLADTGNPVEARAVMLRARELDPLFAQPFALSAMAANYAGDFQSGLELAKQAIAISPAAWVGYLHLGTALFALGDNAGALKAYSDAARYSGGNSQAVASRAFVLARSGYADEARDVIAELNARAADRYVPPYATAVIYAGLGDVDRAFEWLERALVAHDVHLVGLHNDRALELLRGDPRYHSLVKRFGDTAE